MALIAGLALAEGVNSANTVGYTTMSISADTFYLCGIQFEDVGDGTGAISLNDLVSMSGIEACAYSSRAASAAQIQVRNGNTYSVYYYLSDAYDEDADEELEGWADAGGDLATDPIDIGKGFWFKAPAAAINGSAFLVFKGQVRGEASKAVSFAADTFVLAANPFPSGTDLSKVTMSGIQAVGYSSRATSAAQIQVRNGNTYNIYYYLSDAYDEDADEELEGWADAGGDLATSDAIAPGAGFWIKSPSAGSITFSL